MAHSCKLGFWRRSMNLVVRSLLQIRLSPRHIYLLTVCGRKTGKPRSTPVRLVKKAGQRWIVAPYGAVSWVLNARAAGRVLLSRNGVEEIVRIVKLPPEEAAPILKTYITEVPVTRTFFDVTPRSPLRHFVAEAPRHPVFRVLR
jgi:deazaflavin-dependent oxidoreductase (nitroreductase family)